MAEWSALLPFIALISSYPYSKTSRVPGAQRSLDEGGHHFPMADDPDLVALAIAGWWSEEVAEA